MMHLPLSPKMYVLTCIYIYFSVLHMHQTGVRMTNEVIRGGEVVHGAVSDVYDFDQQGMCATTLINF